MCYVLFLFTLLLLGLFQGVELSATPFLLFFQGALNVNDRTIPQPPLLQLSVEKLSRDGAYLMDAGSVS